MQEMITQNDEIRIILGSKVTYIDSIGAKRTFTLVAPGESNPQAGKISIQSPIGSALLHLKLGEKVKVQAPSGEIDIEIAEIINQKEVI